MIKGDAAVQVATSQTRQTNLFRQEIILTEKEKFRKELVEDAAGMKEKLKSMSILDIFLLFDEDDSGLISFEEFRRMLPFLGIEISDAKALRYFRMCDSNNSGEIDIDEFKVALFTSDPTSGNPVGFRPSNNLTPMDAFELFDEDFSGFLDEDEYSFAMEYLKVPASDAELESWFFKKDYTATGKIDYEEFRDIFVEVCDQRKELEERSVDVPALVRPSVIRHMLRTVLIEEEKRERRALAEAKRYKQWVINVRDSKTLLRSASHRAERELRTALDLAGHVYVIGSGNKNQFASYGYSNLKTQKFVFEHFNKVVDLWRDRVRPEQVVDRLNAERVAMEQNAERDAVRELTPLAKIVKELANRKMIIDPYMEAKLSPFTGLNVALNGAALWGRRVHQVAVSESVIFALADTGEIFTWGGNNYWWHEIQSDSIYQTKWRGDTTPRSQLLLNTRNKSLPPDSNIIEHENDNLDPDERKMEMVKTVAKYYNCWEPPSNPSLRMVHIDKEIMPRISYDNLIFSLFVRGKEYNEKTKLELVELFHEDILLEKRLLGERTHKAIREIELQIAQLQRSKKNKVAEKFLKRVEELWAPLKEVQVERDLAKHQKSLMEEHQKAVKSAENYNEWRLRVQEKRDDINPKLTSHGNSLDIKLIGMTPRGPEVATPRGYESSLQIAAGNAHACLVHRTGQLYSWGVGAAGRLGLDLTEDGDPQADTDKPRLVQALSEKPVIRISCGYSHTAAIVTGGELYVWGSTASGKCGLGDIVEESECYCSIPTRVMVGSEDRKVKKVSCGSGHSAVVTEFGHLFVFGCGDGGRLGIGDNYSRYIPTLVRSLTHERVASVSCGNVTTLVCTEVTRQWVGQIEDKLRKLSGGKLYVAGARSVLGRQCNSFTYLPVGSQNEEGEYDTVIKQVSAGYSHSLAISTDGELYCWGNNYSGCCGQPPSVLFVPEPTAVGFLHTKPQNIALKQKAYQSSTYNCHSAKNVVDGNRDGYGIQNSSCTHQESQPWIEIDLGKLAVIDKILIWNRTDSPQDQNLPSDMFTSRLFPCWVMVGMESFPTSANQHGLKEALRMASARVKFVEDKRVNTWRCPYNTQGRYVRVQLEQFNTLSIAQIEVYGHWGLIAGVGRCSTATAGRDVTVAVVRPSTDPQEVEIVYKRAAYSDALNADILRQLETYTLAYDKYGRGEGLLATRDCSICKTAKDRKLDKCESCAVYDTFSADIDNMPPLIGNQRQHLEAISDFLINSNKPPLVPIEVPKSSRTSKWKLRMDAIFGRVSFRTLFPKTSSYVTSEEAEVKNPQELMSTIMMIKNNDNGEPSNLDEMEEFERFQHISDHSVEGNLMDNSFVSEHGSDVFIPGAAKKKRHGYGQDIKSRYEVGDTLPTGGKVRSPFPKSVAQQLNEENRKNQPITSELPPISKKKNRRRRSDA